MTESDEPKPQRPKLLFVCTGNAARSVMAAVITRHYSDQFEVRGAGTFSIEGCPMGTRTRESLAELGMSDPTHRSAQLLHENSDWADLIVAMAPYHVEYVRRKLPEYADKTITLKRFVRDFPSFEAELLAGNGRAAKDEPAPELLSWLRDQVKNLELERVTLGHWEEVEDPASGELEDFKNTLNEIHDLMKIFLSKLNALPAAVKQT